MKIKLKWRVQERPTGRYSAFFKRGWPTAEFADGSPAACIYCEDDYRPDRAKSGDHAPLTINVIKRREGGWDWSRLVKQAATLAEAKAIVQDFYERYPERLPEALRRAGGES